MERELTAEIMDQPDLAPDLHRQALTGIGNINVLSQSARPYLRPIIDFARRQGRPIRIIDIACGGGDNTVGLERALLRRGVDAQVSGCDFSDTALEFSREYAERRGASTDFFAWNVVEQGIPEGFDVCTCSLFLHHLERDESERLLSSMARNARLVLINDLIRSRLGVLLAQVVPRIISRSPVVHTDAVLSARAAYTRAEVRALAAQAGMSGARVDWRWPERFLLRWEREAS